MIIGGHNDIYHAYDFMNGLARVMKGLLRVSTTPGNDYSFCTGWLLTDTLAVIPYYAVTNSTFFCYTDSQTVVQAGLLWPDPSVSRESESPALIRLASPLKGCALSLETKSTVVGDQVMVLQQVDNVMPAHFSMGSVTAVEPEWIKYNASTAIGSGGGPVIDTTTWKIVGMHMASLRDEKINRGLRIDPVLDALRKSGAWLEIVKHHNLAEAAYTLLEDIEVLRPIKFKKLQRRAFSEATVQEDYILKAALSWSFDPEKISDEEKTALQPLVVDVKASSWTLKSKERQRILKDAGSLEKMSKQLPREITDETGQTVIKDILKGAPYNLDEIDEEQLSYWLQAVRWFDGVAPDLPSAAEVNKTLERRQTRSKLANVIRGFRGRKKEIDELTDWYNDKNAGPMLITGIGGMGKSALVGYFVNTMPADMLLLWLDFDRPDIAPDDPVSVLNAIIKQATIQLDNFDAPEISEDNWREGAKQLGELLAASGTNELWPLMILDGFEVAQHRKEYHEIWQVLEEILAGMPRLKVIVSGRAPVKSLKLQDKEATPLKLEGLIDEDAEKWLRERGINDEKVLKVVMTLAEGIPLRLKLAVRLIESGEKVKDLPDKLPQEYITGYLYQRILYRVIDASLIPVVEDILVLRKCSKPMLVKILGDKEYEGLTADKIYDRLSREMALVGDAENLYGSFVVTGNSDKLELRPEVRSATLRLLEQNNKAKVQAMDEQAVNWYSDQDLNDVGDVAELVYHLLRLQRLDEAKKVFKIDCVPLLRDAVNELPEDAHAERQWLEGKVGFAGAEPAESLLSWEIQAALDIKSKLGRGLVKELDIILDSRKERSAASPLIVYDAFNCWLKGELGQAINILKNAGEAQGNVQRDRMLLLAFLLGQNGDWMGASELLERLEDGLFAIEWTDRIIFLTALRAARIRLTVDVEAELKLLELLIEKQKHDNSDYLNVLAFLRRFLTPSDVILPPLNDLFSQNMRLEHSEASLKIPANKDELQEFRKKINEKRLNSASYALSLNDTVIIDMRNDMYEGVLKEPGDRGIFQMASSLALKGRNRWRIATALPILFDLCNLSITTKDELTTQLYFALTGTLAAFRGQKIRFGALPDIDTVIDFSVSIPESTEQPSGPKSELLKRFYLLSGVELIKDIEPGKKFYHFPPRNKGGDAIHTITTYLFSQSPLEILCKSVLGLPETYKLSQR